jgi:hypothetical protein
VQAARVFVFVFVCVLQAGRPTPQHRFSMRAACLPLTLLFCFPLVPQTLSSVPRLRR